MRNRLTGQNAALRAASRAGLASLGLLLALTLAACTTVEGTNALTDPATFEREVMNTTARGVGLIPGEAPKPELTQARAPLALPKAGQALPAPSTEVAAAQLPKDSDNVQIDTSNLTEADLARLRNAKVVDLRSISGRPLTESETKVLMARLRNANADVTVKTGDRPLYLPPDEYFTRVGDADLVCAAPNGNLVSIRDPQCPEDVRKALARQSTAVTGAAINNGMSLTKSETKIGQ
ncbi:hypothetical protein [Devosia sp. FKR38]|uniref:hypothetical protein n=1 Tax=Devosia sp. FKR38 TaxID=2562312 RepID=UPI0010C13E16|nr:hypothetical protein [Devosia sp. FKR38]